MKFYSLSLLLFFFCNNLFGLIHRIEKLSENNSNIILVADYHKQDASCGKQRNDLLTMIKDNNGFVIVEDNQIPFSAYSEIMNNPIEFDQSGYFYSKEDLLRLKSKFDTKSLYGFSSYCFHNQIQHTNVEFRQLVDESLHRGLTNASSVFARSEKIADEINHYNDNELLNAYYKDVINNYENIKMQCSSLFTIMRQSDYPLNLLISKVPYEETFKIGLNNILNIDLSHLNTTQVIHDLINLYNAQFIDARILHTIFLQSQKHPTIFVFAGGNHVKNVAKILGQLGYKRTAVLGKYLSPTYQAPDPIDLEPFIKELQHTKKKTIQLIQDGIELDEISEAFSNNLHKINKEVRKIYDSRKNKRLHYNFKLK